MTKIVVIGGGPGGYVAAIRAAQLGAEVSLVEKENLGGTCLNAGCIPTKALLHSAELLTEAKKSADYGVISNVKLDFSKVQAKKDSVVKQLVNGVSSLMKVNKINVIKGTASFESKDSLMVDGTPLPFDKVIIAAGSVPMRPSIPGADIPECIDSTDVLSLDTVPPRMVIIGGGVIGVEMATAYSAFGCKVTIVEMLDEILPMMDRELTKILRNKLESRGIEILTEARVLSLESKGKGKGKSKGKFASIEVEHKGSGLSLEAEKVLPAIGRKFNTESLGLDNAGIKHVLGRISVDCRQRTNLPDIYAVGDCTGGMMLAHTASMQGEIAAENAMGHKARFDGKTTPSCVYTMPELASVGLSEEQVKAQNKDYIVGRFPLFANGKALITDGTEGLIKIIAGSRYKEILGVHIIGSRATDIIAQAAIAIGLEATLDEIIDTIYAHPTISEAVREAALATYNRAIHIPNKS